MNSKNILEITDLKLEYGSNKAFQNISLEIPRNKVTALVGPSGCGKSSFLSCINRMVELEKNAKITGDILFNSESVFDIPATTLRQKIALVYQQPTPFPFSIQKNFQIPLSEFKLDEIWQDKMLRCLKAVGLYDEVKDRLDSSALSLSGGQQQRLCIARALALEPQIILMDEPCSALDPISSKVIEDLIVKLSKEFTIIIVTHNLAQAKRVSDNMAFFWWCHGAGCLMEHDTTDNIFNSPKSEITSNYILGERV